MNISKENLFEKFDSIDLGKEIIDCPENGKDLFEILETIDLGLKWQIVPKIFLSSYELPFDHSTGQHLKELIQIRNALVHHKPQASNLEEKLDGNNFYNIKNIKQKQIKFEIS